MASPDSPSQNVVTRASRFLPCESTPPQLLELCVAAAAARLFLALTSRTRNQAQGCAASRQAFPFLLGWDSMSHFFDQYRTSFNTQTLVYLARRRFRTGFSTSSFICLVLLSKVKLALQLSILLMHVPLLSCPSPRR
jgi:hypothetical protein